MPAYHLTWEIDLDADSPLDAARQAREIQRDPYSIATVFDVTDETGHTEPIDLNAVEDEEVCAACGRPLEGEENAIHAPNGRSYCRECFDQGQG